MNICELCIKYYREDLRARKSRRLNRLAICEDKNYRAKGDALRDTYNATAPPDKRMNVRYFNAATKPDSTDVDMAIGIAFGPNENYTMYFDDTSLWSEIADDKEFPLTRLYRRYYDSDVDRKEALKIKHLLMEMNKEYKQFISQQQPVAPAKPASEKKEDKPLPRKRIIKPTL